MADKILPIRPGLTPKQQPRIPNAYDEALEAIIKIANKHRRKLIIISDLPGNSGWRDFSRKADPDWINARLDELKHELFAPEYEVIDD
jgi:hypothetical protein